MPRQGSIIALAGAKGGTGKSVLAANLACALHRQTGGFVLLADFDPGHAGDAAQILGVSEPKRNLGQLLGMLEEFSPRGLARWLDQKSPGLAVLPGWNRPGADEMPRADDVAQCLALLRHTADFTVLDLGTGMGPFVVNCLEQVDHVLSPLTPDVLALNQTLGFLSFLRTLAFPAKSVTLVLNRFVKRRGITGEILGAKLERNIRYEIPEAEDLLSDCVSRGETVLEAHPRQPISRAIYSMASDLLSRGVLKQDPSRVRTPVIKAQSRENSAPEADKSQREYIDALKLRIHRRLMDDLDLRELDMAEKGDQAALQELRANAKREVDRLMEQEAEDITDLKLRRRIVTDILDEALGLGPLEQLLADDTVQEIMCNGPDDIFVERNKRMELTDYGFMSPEHMQIAIMRIVGPLNRRFDEVHCMVDARLPDGSRVNAVGKPIALDGPFLTIRKFPSRPLSVDDLVRFDSMDRRMAEFLRFCVEGKLNIMISGGTGSGKTTLLNVLSSFIPSRERIVTIEDSAELQLQQKHVVRMESRPKNPEGKGEVTIRDLVVNALRMRPDRIVVGECRHLEALDMLQAMNTGHDGSLTTIHANTPFDALKRLETLVMFAGLELSSKAVKEQISSAINLVIQQSRQSDGTRKITAISEVGGMINDDIDLQEIFRFVPEGLDDGGTVRGHFAPTGIIPEFLSRLESHGVVVPPDLFN